MNGEKPQGARDGLDAERFPPAPSQSWRLAALVAIGCGMALRLWQYLANPSLWVDEAAVARNVLARDVSRLLGSLDFGQVAPPGFLLAVKMSALLFGGSEQALRLVPLLAGLAAPLLFYFVAREVVRPASSVVATALFSLAVPLIFFSANLKQYSSDVAVALLVLRGAFLLRRATLSPRRACLFALGGALLPFFSHAAAFSLTAAGAVLVAEALAEKRTELRARLALAATWAAAVLVSILRARSVLLPADRAYLDRFWAPGFLPAEGSLRWLWTAMEGVFSGSLRPSPFDGSLHYPAPAVFALLALLGGLALALRKPAAAGLVLGPIGLALLASAAAVYPFHPRLGLFLLPSFLLVIVAGVEHLTDLPGWKGARAAPVLLLPLALWAVVRQPPPWTPEHLRPVMEYVARQVQPGDALWVYYGAGQAYQYYSNRIPLSAEVRVSACDRADPRDLLRQVDALRGRRRVWVLLAHGSGPFGFDERGMLLAYLSTIGRRIDGVAFPAEDDSANRAEAVLFDLSDRARLAASAAERFALAPVPPPRTWTCYGTMSPWGPANKSVAAVLAPPSP